MNPYLAKDPGYFNNERLEMMQFMPQKIERSIEFGCSNGLFSKSLKERYQAECWGVDLNPESIDQAARHLDRAILGEAITVLEHLPADYFDCLICNDFLEHLPYPELFIHKIAGSMKQGAFLVASLPNVRSWSNILELVIHKDWRYKESGTLDKTHLRFYTIRSLRRFLEECNLEIEVIQGTRPSKSLIFKILDILTLRFHHDMQYNGIAVRARFPNR